MPPALPLSGTSSATSSATSSLAINSLLASSPQLWRGREPNRSQRTLSTGHTRLDKRLPGGGWPLGSVSELIAQTHGLGEFSLLFPALAELSRKGEWLVLVDPPWIPYPAALQGHGLILQRLVLVRTASTEESLWACEQALQASRGGAVLAWLELNTYKTISFARLRRLQLAAEAGAKAAFLFRPDSIRNTASPAALRLHLQGGKHCPHEPRPGSTRVEILKSRGQQSREPLWLPCRHPLAPQPNHLINNMTAESGQTSVVAEQYTTLPMATLIKEKTLNHSELP